MRSFILLTASLALAGCVREARIAMPGELAAAERIALTGMGGWERGSFRLGASEGRFTRAATSGEVGGFTRNAGGGTIRARGPELNGEVEAACRYDETELDSGLLTAPIGRLAYRCRFTRDGRPLDGGLVLAEVPTSRSPLAGRSRAGTLDLDGRRLGIRAIHDMEGGALPSGTPLGYRFDVDGRPVGAIDLNGTDRTIYAPPSGPDRQAVLAAALALSIFWDPGST